MHYSLSLHSARFFFKKKKDMNNSFRMKDLRILDLVHVKQKFTKENCMCNGDSFWNESRSMISHRKKALTLKNTIFKGCKK